MRRKGNHDETRVSGFEHRILPSAAFTMKSGSQHQFVESTESPAGGADGGHRRGGALRSGGRSASFAPGSRPFLGRQARRAVAPMGPSSGRSPSLRAGEAPQFAPGSRPFLGPVGSPGGWCRWGPPAERSGSEHAGVIGDRNPPGSGHWYQAPEGPKYSGGSPKGLPLHPNPK